jgi:hypothetical protein
MPLLLLSLALLLTLALMRALAVPLVLVLALILALTLALTLPLTLALALPLVLARVLAFVLALTLAATAAPSAPLAFSAHFHESTSFDPMRWASFPHTSGAKTATEPPRDRLRNSASPRRRAAPEPKGVESVARP